MAYQVLARKYRPLRFADVVGQDHVTVTLMNALTQGRIAHGYIFSGHRGIGKTTIARILASALNCRNPIGSDLRPTAEPCLVCESCTEIRAGNAVDVIEIDAATNRGIDEIRELRDAARYRPARDKYKIYILDEAHQITDAAFNALLKTLEEPPDHIVFMMATTQPEDIPQTVRSRCQHYSFHAVKLTDILSQLRLIAGQENVDADEAALALLAEAGDGSMRDALSIMDQAIASAPVSYVDSQNGGSSGQIARPILDPSQIRELMGTVPNAVFERILEAVNNNSSADVITIANQLLDAGNSPAQLARQLVRYLRNTLIARIASLSPDAPSYEGPSAELLQISPDEQRRAARSASLFTEEELTRFLQVMLRTFDELGYRQEQRFHFELGLLKLVHLRRLLPVEELLSQIPVKTPVFPAPSRTSPAGNPSAAASASASPAAPRASASFAARPSSAPLTAPVTPQKPAFSPFAPPSLSTSAETLPTPPATTPKPAPKFVAPAEAVAAAAPVSSSSPFAPHKPVLSTESNPPAPLKAVLPTEASPASPDNPASSEDPASGGNSSSPESPASPSSDLDRLQTLAAEALASARNQASAADAISDSSFTLTEGELRIQTEVSKTMLPMILNPEAEKLLRATLRDHLPPGTRLVLLPGVAASSSAPKKARAPRSGSAQAKALDHPIVQQAQRLFDAEVRTVIDLRDN